MKLPALKAKILIPAVLSAFVLATAGGWIGLQSLSAEPLGSGPVSADFVQTRADIKVFKTPTCGCCSDWVTHLEDNGFQVEAVDVSHQQLNAIKQTAGLSRELASCHTGFIDGYVVEGHVPADDIRKLLELRPAVTGLSVPGMPIGSPGMEMGDRLDPFHVVSFDEAGNTEVFSSYNQ